MSAIVIWWNEFNSEICGMANWNVAFEDDKNIWKFKLCHGDKSACDEMLIGLNQMCVTSRQETLNGTNYLNVTASNGQLELNATDVILNALW